MKVMVLAAGRGARLAPLTDSTPKPLIKVAGKALIDYQLERLQSAGFKQFVINLGYLGEQLCAHVERTFGGALDISYSSEPSEPFETGGGIKHALALLDEKPFAVVNADIWTDFDYRTLPRSLAGMAHLILVPNPPHNPAGDFGLDGKRVVAEAPERHTFSGISVINPIIFKGLKEKRFPLAPLLRSAANRGEVSGVLYEGAWFDAGTPQRLTEIYHFVAAQ